MRRAISITILVLLSALVLAPVLAQEEDEAPGPITWIGFSKLRAGKTAEDATNLAMESKEFMDGLVANGTIVSYGSVTPINHDPGDKWNYADFVTVESWSKIGEWIGAFLAHQDTMSEKEKSERRERSMAIHEPGSHHDLVVRHVGFVPGNQPPQFLYLAHFNIDPDKGDDAMALFKGFVKPTMSGLQASGDMGAIGLYVSELHGVYDWTHVYWYSLPSLAAVDKFQATLQEAAGPAENAWAQSVINFESHYDKILLVTHYGGPEAGGGN
jgi:hypothetical protein